MPITSLSISSSEREPGASWRAFATAFGLTAGFALAALLALAFLLDPYDSGRSPLAWKAGVRPQGARTAAASRGRDPRFAGAVLGNSHVQMLSPERLDKLTGVPFVQLSIPGTGPKEQLAVLEWFRRHHRDGTARALVLGIDDLWCTGDPAIPNAHAFPFWLFSPAPGEYLRGLLRWSVLQEMPRRIVYLVSAKGQRAPPDGYWDYAPEFARLAQTDAARLAAARNRRWPEDAVGNVTGDYPAAERLGALIAPFPPELAVVLVHPPIFAAGLSPRGSPRFEDEARCKSAFVRAAQAHARTAIVDWRVDRPETRDPDLFFDQTHYREPLARLVEADIAGALEDLPGKALPQGAPPPEAKGSR